jgi:putative peptidoglycan lipid II flippase
MFPGDVELKGREETGADEKADIVKRHRNLGGRTILISTLTLFSRLLGYGRDLLMASLFGGSSPVLDAFITGWRVPNLFRRFLGEGALGVAFQRTLTTTEASDGLEGGRRLFRAIAKLLLPTLVITCGAAMLLVWNMPDRMPITGWPWLGADPGHVRELTVRLMPYLIVVCLTALAVAALNVRGRFTASTWTAPTMNLVWISTLVAVGVIYGWSGPVDPDRHLAMARVLAGGVLIAGLAQLLVVVRPLWKEGFLGPGVASSTEVALARPATATARVLRDTFPLALGAAAYQVNMMVDGLMAEGLLSDGGPTAQFFANRFHQFPLALGAFAVMTAVFPSLQALVAKGERREARRLHDRAQLTTLFLALPASCGMFVLAEPLVRLFEHGRFDSTEVARTALALKGLCLAIVPAGACAIAVRAHYAFGATTFIAAISSVVVVVNIAGNLFFVRSLGMDVEGLALGSAVASWLSLGILLVTLRVRYGERSTINRLGRRIGAMVPGAVAAGLTGGWVHGLLAGWVGNTLALLAGSAAGALLYFLLAAAVRPPELDETLARIRRRFR